MGFRDSDTFTYNGALAVVMYFLFKNFYILCGAINVLI